MKKWREQTRENLNDLLPEALVVLPIGATEQHGPHLATAVDALLAETVTTRAAERAAEQGCSRELVVTPTLAFGASDHHLPFGGTLSLRPETLLTVLLDIARSVAESGGRRLVIVNGHGGNRGICSAAAAAAPVRHPSLAVAYVDYWSLLSEQRADVPGHAGIFETALALAVEPGLVRDRKPRAVVPEMPRVEGVELASRAQWHDIDGFTDTPDKATEADGKRWLEDLVVALAARFSELAEKLPPTTSGTRRVGF